MNKQTQKDLLEIVRKNYEEIAGQFNETRKKFIWPELLSIAKDTRNGDRILDVGCGNGRLLDAFADFKIDYLGVDASANLIELAKQNHPERKFVTGDILDLGVLSDYGFDHVYSVAVLHHLPGRDLRVAALRQLKNKANDDGRIIVTVWNMWDDEKKKKSVWRFFFLKLIGKNHMDFGDALFDWSSPDGTMRSQRYYHAFTKRELKGIVKEAGLKIVGFKKDQYNYYLILKKV